MALNYSHRPIFSAHIAEENLVSPMRILNGGCLVEGVPERKGDGLSRPRHGNRKKIEECFEYGRDMARGGVSAESGYKDIIDLLPADPFGMDISSTMTAITSWLEDLKVDYGRFGSSVGGSSGGEYSLFAGLNLICNNAIKFQSFPGSVQFNEKVRTEVKGNCDDGKREFGDPFGQYGFGSACNQEYVGFNNGANSACVTRSEEKADGLMCSFVKDEEASQNGLSYGLGYLEMGTMANHDDGRRDFRPAMPRYGSRLACDELNIAGFNFGNDSSSLMQIVEKAEGSACCFSVGEGASDKAFSFALGFMETEASEDNDVTERDFRPALTRYGSGSASGKEEIPTANNASGISYLRQIKQNDEGSICCSDEDEGSPHSALSSALDYLDTDTKGNHDDEERGCGYALAQHCSSSGCKDRDIADFTKENNSISMTRMEGRAESSTCTSDGDEGAPHRALSFALGYLGVRDLLSVERVCKSLHSTVRTDSLLWRNIHIEQPLNERITDDILLQLTNRAQGNLHSLSLVECPRVTDDGVRHVLERNLRLTKLCVPGCTRLSAEGILSTIKAFNSHKDTEGIKHLRIGGLYGITDEHFEELKVLLRADSRTQESGKKPHFYHRRNSYLLCEDDRAIDVEACPRCLKLRLVYDCPAEGCQVKDCSAQVCRACILCIPRCVQCGRCIVDNEYEETFCLELLCACCFKQLLNCEDEQD